MHEIILPLDAFVRSVCINKSTPHSLFLGAGASISSGIPSAERCIWEWKKNIFLTNNPGLEKQFSEISLSSVKQKIQDWIDRRGGYPVRGSPEEYGFYIEKCYPLVDDRRLYFQEKVKNARPYTGYKLVCLLTEKSIVKSVWTTNFDNLYPRTASQFSLTVKEVGIDCQHRIDGQYRKDEVLHVAMHGDYRYDQLKNTTPELQKEEEKLQNSLIKHVVDTPFIVVGYSGRDNSLMNSFEKAYSQPGSGTLYWCGYNEDVPNNVGKLIALARQHNRKSFYIPTLGFDDLFHRLALHCIEGSELETVNTIASVAIDNRSLARKPFGIEDMPVSALIKSNCFRIECPSEVFEFGLKKWPQTKIWKSIENTIKGKNLVAVPFKKRLGQGKVLCLGTISEIKEVFAENIDGDIKRVPISDKDMRFEDGAVVSLFLQGLSHSLSKSANLSTDGKRTLWSDKNPKYETYDSNQYLIYNSAFLFLRCFGLQTYLIIKPSIKIADKLGNEAPEEVRFQIKMKIFGYQHNREFNDAMDYWRKCLFPQKDGGTVFEYPLDSGSGFKFKIKPVPSFAKIGSRVFQKPIKLPPKVVPYIEHTGVRLSEPMLLFSNKQGNQLVKDHHPIRGIVSNRPYDYSLTQRGLASDIRIGVICPEKEQRLFADYLNGILHTHSPSRSQSDYLLDFPGFATAFGVPIQIPQPGGSCWLTCLEPNTNLSIEKGALELSRILRQSINTLKSCSSPDVMIIFIPERWKKWRRFENDSESFDLHNIVKAYCVQQGITSQFLEQETLVYPEQSRVWWWFSLALYVKNMRTPWLLDCLDDKTAFVGLGFGINRNVTNGEHIVVGCSHIYNAQGEGLQYRLSKVENPVMRRRNPFMSKDDARRVGEVIRQLFYDSRFTLPDRVVIHKQTPFLKEEQEGLCEGLQGVNCIDMIEINTDKALRYVSSFTDFLGNFKGDHYPVKRGTVIVLDNYTALLWVHGSTSALDSRKNYYQGKRRIPAPLIIRRYMGASDVETIAREILGLSKMNWNTFDLYTKLPATVQSSGQIAKIGSLLQRFGTTPYDYRLFI